MTVHPGHGPGPIFFKARKSTRRIEAIIRDDSHKAARCQQCSDEAVVGFTALRPGPAVPENNDRPIARATGSVDVECLAPVRPVMKIRLPNNSIKDTRSVGKPESRAAATHEAQQTRAEAQDSNEVSVETVAHHDLTPTARITSLDRRAK